MKSRSCKNKGRRCSVEIKELLHKYAPELKDSDIKVKVTSEPGTDLHLSGAAFLTYPYAIEAKNVERLNMWEALDQAEANAEGAIPIVFFRRNRSRLFVAIDAETFMKLTTKPVKNED